MSIRERVVDGLSKGIGESSVEQLASIEDANPQSRSVGERGISKLFGRISDDADEMDVVAPDKDNLQEYWRLFETTPILRESIRSFASEVVKPGYWVDAENEETREFLEDWLKEAAIVEGEMGNDAQVLFKKSIIQRDARGTCLVEHVGTANDLDELVALKLINPETVKAYTREGQAILLQPDDDIPDAPTTKDSKTGAYVQYDDSFNRFEEKEEVVFPQDRITKFTRDADVGEIFGTSRVEAVSDRVKGLKRKLKDNDAAIESKAWPFWLFVFGSEEYPWTNDEIDDFMEEHDADEFGPGKKQGVAGDVEIQTISGEVAELAETLEFDINWIMSSMPIPKYALGSFERNINQFVSESQQNRLDNQIQEARQELEKDFTPALRKKAELENLPNPEEVELKLEKSPEEKEREIKEKRQKKMLVEGESPDGEGSDGPLDAEGVEGDDPQNGDADSGDSTDDSESDEESQSAVLQEVDSIVVHEAEGE